MIQKATVQKVKIVSKPSLRATLMSLPHNKPVKFSTKDFKTIAARQCISTLRKEKMDFDITEAGLNDEYIVTRKK